MSQEAKIIAQTKTPLTKPGIIQALRALGLGAGQLVMVHCAMSRLGWVVGNEQALLEALFEVLGAEGTLMMPAFSSDWSDPADWEAPPVPEDWWPTIREHWPAFDPALTPTRGLGRLPERFRVAPGTMRSLHPNVSFAARGPLAESLTSKHPLNDGLGQGGPLGRFYMHGGKVLLLGVGYESCTLLHLGERLAMQDRTRSKVLGGAAMMVEGQRQWVELWSIETNHDDFPSLGEAFERARPASITRGRVGLGQARLIEGGALVDFASKWVEHHRG